MTPGALVRAVAAAFDLSEAVVAQHDRRLAEEGFRTKGGRGASAPQVTAEDAAKLIIATLAGERFSQTFATVRDLWNAPVMLPPVAQGTEGPGHALVIQQQIKSLSEFDAAISNECNFGEATSALLKDCINGQMEAFLKSGNLAPRQRFQLRVIRPSAEAKISFGHTQSPDASLEFNFRGATDSDVSREITTTHEISVLPLLRIAEQMRTP